MLKIKNLNCTIKGTNILNIAKLEIDKPGLYIILGPSGCGKTTLLNVIAGLNRNFTGEVSLFHRNFRKLREKEIVRFRSSHFSIFFQHNTFIEELTLAENIALAKLHHTPSLKELSATKVTQIAHKLQIEPLLNRKIKLLSGGEKTRGAIARTLYKDSPLYLFDEPTAALDKENAEIVMNLIKEKSQKSIIILVTHDEALANLYAARIIKMDYGKISEEKENDSLDLNATFHKSNLINYEKNSVSIANGLLKAKRWRHLVSGVSVNVGLVGLGLSLLLVNAINTKLVNAFKGQFDENTAFVTQSFAPAINVIKSVAKNDIHETIGHDYEVGALYLNDFRETFPDLNEMSFEYGNSKHTFPSYHAGLFNEAIFLSEVKTTIYPYISSLGEDEIGLVLPFDDFKLMQNALRIPFRSTADELGNYLHLNNLIVTLNVENKTWDYEDEQSFILKTVTLGQEPQIIRGSPEHTTNLFEEKMMLPSSLNLTKIEEYPWTLKKINYVYRARDYETFIWQSRNYQNYIISSAKTGYFTYLNDAYFLQKRFLIFEKPPHFNDILSLDESSDLDFYTFGGGLTFIPEMMLVGFAQNFFFAENSAVLNEVIKLDREHKETLTVNFSLPAGIVNFAVQYNSFSSFNYLGVQRNYLLHEISISKGLALKLFNRENVVGQEIHLGALLTIEDTKDGYLKTYGESSLKIVSVEDNDDVIIYHHPLWSYYLFIHEFGVDPFAAQLYGAIFNDGESILLKDNSNFDKSYPYREFKNTINSTLGELEQYTLIAALGAFLLSSLIIFMIIYLLVAETNDQFSSLYLMGYTKEAIQKVITSYIYRFVGLITLLALGQLFLFSFVIEFILSDYLAVKFLYVFNYFPYLFVFLFAALLISLLLNIFRFRMQKLELLQFSKRDL